MRTTTRSMLVAAAAGLLAGGCITHKETVYSNVSRVKVEFENETAAGIFYGALDKHVKGRGVKESSTTVQIPLIFKHSREKVSGDSAAFNEGVARADANHDGKITEAEARAFAEKP